MSQFPNFIGVRVGDATNTLIKQAKKQFGVSGMALGRMALDDFMPRYMATSSRGIDAKLMAQIAESIRVNPKLSEVYRKTAKDGIRRGKAA